jgi:site-specific DNA recombinase
VNDLKAEFDRHNQEGFLGNPEGSDAYAYLRASSERQVEYGSSFTRQIENIHEAAKKNNLRIPFVLIFFDDGYTGFEFEHRPALLRLRHEIATNPRAFNLVIEDIDRLSRNADWQQGYLLEEFSRHDVEVHFYISPGSQLERYVRGYIAQEGMKKDRERMRMGNVYKAMSGKVTAKRPLYGYVITDPQNSFYELHPDESKVVRIIFDQLIYEGKSLKKICEWLNDNQVPTRFKGGVWAPGTIYRLFKNPVYMGIFHANKNYFVITGYRKNGKPKKTRKVRPKEEWIEIPVPSIVSPGEWELAQEILRKNATRSMRNAKKRNWLLSGFLRCGVCREFTLSAQVGGSPNKPIRYYGCYARRNERPRVKEEFCKSAYIQADIIERRVWEEIEQVIYNPSKILKRLEYREKDKDKREIHSQLEFIDMQLGRLEKEKEKYEAAYERDIYTLDEFAEKMTNIRIRKEALEESKKKVEEKLTEIHDFEEKKRVVINALNKVKSEIENAKKEVRPSKEIPFELKRRILSIMVKVIWVNTTTRTFEIVGEIKGQFSVDDTEFGFTSARKSR